MSRFFLWVIPLVAVGTVVLLGRFNQEVSVESGVASQSAPVRMQTNLVVLSPSPLKNTFRVARNEETATASDSSYLPYPEQIARDHEDLHEEWLRMREDILAQEFGPDSDVLSRLNERSLRYEKERDALLYVSEADRRAGRFMSVNVAAVTELVRQYHDDVAQLVGEQVFENLNQARAELSKKYTRGDFTIPQDVY